MNGNTINSTILIAGGDEREVELAKNLVDLGAEVLMSGFERYFFDFVVKKMSIKKALPLADTIICPLPGINEKGNLYAPYSDSDISLTITDQMNYKNDLPLIIGKIPVRIEKELERKGLKIIKSLEIEEITILNAIPTAEGAIMLAMQENPITIWQSKCLVAGFGRCGKPLAAKLQFLGADVSVVARRPEVLAEIKLANLTPVTIKDLPEAIKNKDMIFNTIPALIFPDQVLSNVDKNTYFLDLASQPGGLDFEAAKKRALKVNHALGLPGKLSPVTAGKILFEKYLTIILDQK